MGFRFTQSGSFKNSNKFLKALQDQDFYSILDQYGRIGVAELAAATPKDSGITADSWGYNISIDPSGATLTFTNDSINDGVPIAIILQYGHGTGTGGYVEGRDYINPAIQPVFDNLAKAVWKGVKSL